MKLFMMNKLHATRPEVVGKRLEITRIALGFQSRREFYAPVGLGESATSMWESGDRFPRVQHVVLLCKEYGLTLDWIYRGVLSSLPHRTAMLIRSTISTLPDGNGEALSFTVSENET